MNTQLLNRGVTLTAALLFALLLTSCATLPAPKSEEDTALAIPVQYRTENDASAHFGYYEITVRKAGDSGFYRMLRIYPQSDLEVITGFEPGTYRLEQYQFRYKEGGGSGSSRPIGISFTVQPGAITVSPLTFVVTSYKENPDTDQEWLRFGWHATESSTREDVLSKLRESENFSRWTVRESVQYSSGATMRGR